MTIASRSNRQAAGDSAMLAHNEAHILASKAEAHYTFTHMDEWINRVLLVKSLIVSFVC